MFAEFSARGGDIDISIIISAEKVGEMRTPIMPHDSTTQIEKDFCLYNCPFADDCNACEQCNGMGHTTKAVVRSKGRPKATLDVQTVLQDQKTMNAAQICKKHGISRRTLYRALAAII